MSNSTTIMSLEIQDYIRTLEDALTDVIDGQLSHDLVPSIGCTEKRADELVELCSSILQRGIGKSFPDAVVPPAPADLSTVLEQLDAGGIDSSDLDSAVDEAAAREATDINGSGIEGQVRYLSGTGMKDAAILDSVGLD